MDAEERLRAMFGGEWNLDALVRFHTAHKLLLMAHSPDAYRSLGRLVAGAGDVPREELERRYTETFVAALSTPATIGGHTNVLQHVAGYFKKLVDASAKAELHSAIRDYQAGRAPLSIPMALLRRHIAEHNVTYLAGQIYLRSEQPDFATSNQPDAQ